MRSFELEIVRGYVLEGEMERGYGPEILSVRDLTCQVSVL